MICVGGYVSYVSVSSNSASASTWGTYCLPDDASRRGKGGQGVGLEDSNFSSGSDRVPLGGLGGAGAGAGSGAGSGAGARAGLQQSVNHALVARALLHTAKPSRSLGVGVCEHSIVAGERPAVGSRDGHAVHGQVGGHDGVVIAVHVRSMRWGEECAVHSLFVFPMGQYFFSSNNVLSTKQKKQDNC